MAEDVLDIILRLSNLQRFVAGTREAASGVASIGAAGKKATAESAAGSSRMAGVVGVARKAAMGIGLAAAGIAYESTKMDIEFRKQMEMIHTQAGARQSEVARQSANVLGMAASGNFAQGPTDLAKGLFHLESVGLRGAHALDTLKVASQGAAVGNADLEQTATALGAAWIAGIRGGTQLHTVMAALNATVGAGNMRMQSLVDSLGTGVLPASKIAGLGLRDVMSALAILSDEGYHGYSAMAQFATSLHFITDPGKKATAALGQLHLTQLQLADTMRKHGLIAALTQFHDRLAAFGKIHSKSQANALIGNIFPAGRGRVLEVLLNQYERLRKKQAQIAANTRNFGNDVAATHRTAAFKIHAAWSMIQSDMIKLGHVLSPVAVFFAQGIAKVAGWLVKIPKLVHDILTGSGGMGKFHSTLMDIEHMVTSVFDSQFVHSLLNIGHTLVTVASKIGHAFLTIGRMALPGFITMFRGAMNVVAGIVNFVGNIIRGHFGRAFHAIGQIASGFFHTFKGAIMVVAAPIRFVAGLIWSLISGAFNKVLGFVKTVPGRIGAFFSGIGNGIGKIFDGVVGIIVSALNWVIKQINNVISAYNSVASSVPFIGGNLTVGQINPISGPPAPGSPGTPTGPGGPRAGPRARSTIPGRTGGATPRGVVSHISMARTSTTAPNFVVPVSINGREVARAVGKVVQDKKTRR